MEWESYDNKSGLVTIKLIIDCMGVGLGHTTVFRAYFCLCTQGSFLIDGPQGTICGTRNQTRVAQSTLTPVLSP